MAKAPLASSEPDNLTLRHLQALRREIQALSESQEMVLKNLARQGARLDELAVKIEREFHEVKSDIAALEIKDFGRHGELLTVLRKLQHIDEDE